MIIDDVVYKINKNNQGYAIKAHEFKRVKLSLDRFHHLILSLLNPNKTFKMYDKSNELLLSYNSKMNDFTDYKSSIILLNVYTLMSY